MTPPPPRTPPPSQASERRLFDYLMVVREHWLAALLTGGLVLGAFAVWTLYATSMYETAATIQLQEKDAEQKVLTELSSVESTSSVESEMEVMRSYRIAEGAAVIGHQSLDPHPKEDDASVDDADFFSGPVPQLTSLCWEKHAYRPLASLMRRLGQRKGPAVMHVRTKQVPSISLDLELAFGDDPHDLTLTDTNDASHAPVHVQDFTPEKPVEAFGLTLTLSPESGHYAGRTFVLRIRPPKETARWIMAGRSVELVGDRTGIVQIAFTAPAPHVAHDVVNALARSYLAYRNRKRTEDLEQTTAFLDKRVNEVNEELERKATERDDFAAKSHAYELRARAPTIPRDRSEAKLRKAELKSKLQALEEERTRWLDAKTLDDRLGLLVTIKADPQTSSLATEYQGLQRQISIEKGKGRTEDHQILVGLRVQLEAVQAQLEKRLELLVTTTLDRLKAEGDGLTRQIEETEKTLESYKQDLQDLPEIERQLATLTRDVETQRRSLERLKDKQVEVQLSKASNKIPAALIDRALIPRGRKSPNVTYMILLGALFGLLAGIGAAFVRDALDHKVRSPSQLEEILGLATYASIPGFGSVRRKDKKAQKGPLVAMDAPKSVVTEAYRSLRANIRFATRDKQMRALAITSALSGEGKTVTTLNLATVLADGGSSVVVVDADLRRSMVHHYMEGERAPGMTEVLLGEKTWRDAVQHTKVEGFDIVTAGRRHESPGLLLDSEAFQNLLRDLREAYEYVLVDMPPVLAVSDAAPFFANLDGVLLLCRSGRCPVGVYVGAREQVERLGGKVVGTIFNGFDARRVGRRGYGYYGSSGTYGYYGYHAYYAYDEGRRKRSRNSEEAASAPEGNGSP